MNIFNRKILPLLGILLTTLLNAQPINDNYGSAIDVSSIIGNCSGNAAYNNNAATADKNAAGCWNNSGPRSNVWFKFKAPSTGSIYANVQTGGSKGNLRNGQLALWESNGTTELACDRYHSTFSDIDLGATALVPGQFYYLSVDVYRSNYTGTFTLCLDSTLDYDFYEGAKDITSLIGNCSANKAYTTSGASADKNKGSCWNNSGPKQNRWFKFTAPTTGSIKIDVQTDGAQGNQRTTQAALWESNGTTEVDCDRYHSTYSDVDIGSTNLVPGQTYYLSVDVYQSNYAGSFTICADSTVDYDYYEGAIDITSYIGTCSPNRAYSTDGASADQIKGSCWDNSGPKQNRWFKFTAPTTGSIKIDVQTDGAQGNQRTTQVALWESDGTTEIDCDRYHSTYSDVDVGATNLVPGQTYYLSVDVYKSYYAGSFTICVDSTVDYDYYEGAIDITSLIGSCSPNKAYTTNGASADKNKGSCWNNSGPKQNRWFKFIAPSTGSIKIDVQTRGAQGNQRTTQVALWENNGTTELYCDLYYSTYSDVDIGSTNLVPGQTYYLSVDVYKSYYAGSFTICVDSTVDYDYYEGAIDITSYIGICSPNMAYSTEGASADKNKGSCWNNSGPIKNRWFKFTAPSTGNINIEVQTNGFQGDQRTTQLTLWESNGTTEIDCDRYHSTYSDVDIGSLNLIPGQTYYLSVDVYKSNYAGTFTICVDSTVSYDYYEGAINVTQYIGGCSPDALYSTAGASADKNAASCWNISSPVHNRWFKFVAPASGMIDVKVSIGGAKGDQRATEVALWESDGITEVECNRYSSQYGDVSVGSANLQAGHVYYISVDVYASGYSGSFTLCLEDEANYDYFGGAIELTNLNNWCSANAEYTTRGATPDYNAGSCWNNSGPRNNRWFKFKAVTKNVSVRVKVGGAEGTQEYTQLALWENDGVTEVECKRYSSKNGDVFMVDSNLVVGNWYYISVDSRNNRDGSFTLCIDNVNEEYYSIANGNWNNPSNWSTVSHTGPVASSYPIGGDVAYIQGNQIQITNSEAAAQINLDVATNDTELKIDGGSLMINGMLKFENQGNNFKGEINIESGGDIYVNDKLLMNRNGGNKDFKIVIDNAGKLEINKDLALNSTAGTVFDNEIELNGNAQLSIKRDLLISESGGPKSSITVNANGLLQLYEDASFTATADNQIEITMNGRSRFKMMGDFILGTPAYGMLDFSSNAVLEFAGTSAQNFPSLSGSGTGDFFNVNEVVINNTYGAIPQINLTKDIVINGTLTLNQGVVDGNNTYRITIANGASISTGNPQSYIDGELRFIGNGNAFFPLGDGEVWAPLELKNLSGNASTEFTAQYKFKRYANQDVDASLNNVSKLEFWDIHNSGSPSDADVTLHWKDQYRSKIDDYADLVVAHFNGVEWHSIGKSSVVSNDPGSITINQVSSFSPFTFGSNDTLANPLPVVLQNFSAEAEKNNISLFWSTVSEINNDYFTVEKSTHGINFTPIAIIKGQGNSNMENFYSTVDENPNNGVNYYRLKQTDFDGKVEYFDPIAIHFNKEKSWEMLVYPNPSEGRVNIKVNNNESLYTIKLMRTDGKVISTVESSRHIFKLNLPEQSGIYFLELIMKNEHYIQKVVKY